MLVTETVYTEILFSLFLFFLLVFFALNTNFIQVKANVRMILGRVQYCAEYPRGLSNQEEKKKKKAHCIAQLVCCWLSSLETNGFSHGEKIEETEIKLKSDDSLN